MKIEIYKDISKHPIIYDTQKKQLQCCRICHECPIYIKFSKGKNRWWRCMDVIEEMYKPKIIWRKRDED